MIVVIYSSRHSRGPESLPDLRAFSLVAFVERIHRTDISPLSSLEKGLTQTQTLKRKELVFPDRKISYIPDPRSIRVCHKLRSGMSFQLLMYCTTARFSRFLAPIYSRLRAQYSSKVEKVYRHFSVAKPDWNVTGRPALASLSRWPGHWPLG